MKIKRMIQTIDTHTVGMPTRTVVSGLPFIPGNTMSEKMLFMKENKGAQRKQHHVWSNFD